MPLAIEPSLVQSAKSDRAALERLIETVWPEAYRIALTVLRDRGLAEDAAQEACVTLARSLPALRDVRTFSAWMYRIVANRAISTARSRPPMQSLDRLVDPAATYDCAETLDLDDALAKLPVSQRAVVLLHYYAGLNSSEIAAATRLPASTVRFHIMLARRALRKALEVGDRPSPLSDEVFSNAR